MAHGCIKGKNINVKVGAEIENEPSAHFPNPIGT